ncbi:biotin synthase [Klebsiella pneumoniae]|nr:biotin synthase [Klebsiella pneumoniae]
MAHQPRWTMSQVTELFNKPLIDLLFEAQQIHRQHFDPRQVQVSTLLSIKTGACPEDCKYCPQSARYKTGLEAERLMEVEQVLESARQAKNAGSTRFCMGAAWKNPNDRDMPYLEQMVKGVKALGLESCMTLGTLTDSQAQRLAEAGLDYYNHNLDTSPEFYGNIITTRTYQERLDTLDKVRDAGIKVCSGGIVGLGESVKDRAGLLLQLANLPTPPESVPINMLVKVKGTPLADNDDVDAFDFHPHYRHRAHHDAHLLRASLRRPRADERADPGDVLYGRGELDFLRLQAADHAEPGRGQRPAAVPQAGDQPAADGGAGRRQ